MRSRATFTIAPCSMLLLGGGGDVIVSVKVLQFDFE